MVEKTFVKIFILLFVILALPVSIVSAQIQDDNFSGNDPSSYSCYTRQGDLVDAEPIKDESKGLFYCNVNGVPGYQPCDSGIYETGDLCDPQAVLNPPTLQQLEVWFVRIVYSIWAIAATFSFLGIVYIGYQYMISRGAPEATVKVKDRLAKFIIGFALVFLAVPILTTVFRLLYVNDSVQCYQGLTSNVGIGFQFVFPELCTDPNNQVANSDPCDDPEAEGLVCNNENELSDSCPVGEGRCVVFICSDQTWVLSRTFNCNIDP